MELTRGPDALEYNGKPLFPVGLSHAQVFQPPKMLMPPFPSLKNINTTQRAEIPQPKQSHKQTFTVPLSVQSSTPVFRTSSICNSPGLLGDLSYMGREQSSVRDLTGATEAAVITSDI